MGCAGAAVDYITSKRAEPDSFVVHVTGDKVRDETGGNRLVNLAIELLVAFPEGTGDVAREALPRAARMSRDRLCTVPRTVELGSPVDTAPRRRRPASGLGRRLGCAGPPAKVRRWRHYRGTVEPLKAEGWMYVGLAGRYARDPDRRRAFPDFAERVGATLVQETEEYIAQAAAQSQPPPDANQHSPG